jgi:hypothetical protein
MGPVLKEVTTLIIRDGNRRLIEIPEAFFLEGEEICRIQDRDGAISVHPAEDAARDAMWARFNPFVEWENGTWPIEVPLEDKVF